MRVLFIGSPPRLSSSRGKEELMVIDLLGKVDVIPLSTALVTVNFEHHTF
jgi:hypothetical protein